MAAVFVPPSPQQSNLNMSMRRPPLANVPNGTNSPLRSSVVPSKRSRTASSQQLDIPYGQPPPSKKQMAIDGTGGQQHTVTEARDARTYTKSASQQQQQQQQPADSRLFSRKSTAGQPSAFEKRLHAARDRDGQQTASKSNRTERPPAETLDTIRQWQKHYRRAFPGFVFYFDTVPQEARAKCSRQVHALGAQEEKFFSRVVTHVITCRPIPPENSAAANPPEGNRAAVDHAGGDGGLTQTVNPSLLEKNPEMHIHMSLKNDARREQTNMDVLYRARRMGMKIWALEKLQRMISTINDPDIGGHQDNSTRGQNATGGGSRAKGEADLSQVLRNELVSGPSDRDHLSSLKEMTMFKGPFIYIHDMNEKTRPVMAREYPKVSNRQDGIWPQFRSAPLGRCPFIEEAPSKKEWLMMREQEKEQEKRNAAKAAVSQKPPKVAPATTDAKPAGEPVEEPRRTPEEEQTTCPPAQPEMHEMGPPKPGSPRKSSESFIPPQMSRTGPFYTGHEPAASGMQPSNVTSAIRSQMVSSTAAAPGAKAGLSKQVHELKRKVLEKGNGLSANATSAIGSAGDSNPVKPNPQDQKPGKSHAKENYPNVAGEGTVKPEGQNAAKKQSGSKKSGSQKKERPRDPKPGFCENCRDKFDDFEEHTKTRKHRRFALTSSNWVELDDLLYELERPLKYEYAHTQYM